MRSIYWCILVFAMLIITAARTDKSILYERNNAASIDGGWKLVWAQWNDTIVDVLKNPQIKFFAAGSFSLLGIRADGKVDYAGYGTYDLDGTSYQETFLYHDNPEYIGAMDWQELELKGDTLYARGFVKVIVKGKEVTKDFPVIVEKRVRIPNAKLSAARLYLNKS